MALINDLFVDNWRPWIAIYCGDGRWADKVASAICSTMPVGLTKSLLGSVSTLAKFIRNENVGTIDSGTFWSRSRWCS